MDNNPAVLESRTKKKRKNKKKASSGTTASVPAATQVPEASKLQEDDESASEAEQEHEESDVQLADTSAATSMDDEISTNFTNGTAGTSISNDMAAATARFDALVRDRDALREEVTRLRQSLEEVQRNHDREMSDVRGELESAQGERESAEENYQNLVGKVNTIRSQLGERLKADAEDLAQARMRIDELEDQKTELETSHNTKLDELESLSSRNAEMDKELRELRGRATLSQQNWVKEREEMRDQENYWKDEFDQAKQAMRDWEVLAMEERSIRRDLSDKVSDLEEQLSSVQKDYERAAGDRDTHSGTVDGLQKAMQEIQNARKKELREIVETSQAELQDLRKQCEDVKVDLKAVQDKLEQSQRDLDRVLPFEKEVAVKNLLIGKLRHEAVILNDHLTKALRFLKKGKPEDNIDRQIVTNHFLQFLALDRSDPRKFQILQLIASLLNWTDEQKEQAGLQRAGGVSNTGSLRLPGLPMMHKTPSSPALSRLETDYLDQSANNGPAHKESLADLWQSFLEQEAQTSTGTKSRTASTSTATGIVSPALSQPSHLSTSSKPP